jgi:hypothetical protein
VAGGTVALTDMTLSSNTAQGGYGGLYHEGSGLGGGLYAAGGTVTMRNDTVATNSAQGHGPVGQGGSLGEGGGLYIDPLAAVCLDVFTSAHVTNNTASTRDANIHGPWTPC